MNDQYWRRIARRLRNRLLPTLGARTLPGIEGRVHRADAMLYDTSEESIVNYVRAAQSAMENLEAALEAGGRRFEDIESCLDFGCGHGRVLRLLQQRIPARRITACDVDEGGVRFCAAEFGVRPLVSNWDIDRIRLGSYDFIWSGSVLTHLDGDDGDRLLKRLGESLQPGGLLVFSLHGEYCREGLDQLYGGLYSDEAETIRREVAEQGYSFRVYRDEVFGRFPSKYGMTWHDLGYVDRRADELSGGTLERVYWRPRGWDHHHDVVGYRKRDGASPGLGDTRSP